MLRWVEGKTELWEMGPVCNFRGQGGLLQILEALNRVRVKAEWVLPRVSVLVCLERLVFGWFSYCTYLHTYRETQQLML